MNGKSWLDVYEEHKTLQSDVDYLFFALEAVVDEVGLTTSELREKVREKMEEAKNANKAKLDG